MIKKSTLLALLCAIVLGGAVYYLDWKRGEKEKPPEDTSKLAFSFQAADISSLVLAHPDNPSQPAIALVKRDGVWQVAQPLATGADQASVSHILDGIASARIAQTEPGSSDRLKVYGLDPPQVALDFQLQNGAKHTLKLGNKDFTGSSVYAVVDGGKDVALLPESLLVVVNKPLDDLRDRAVLHIVAAEVKSLDLKNSSGQFAVTKDKAGWRFAKPAVAPSPDADDVDVNALLAAVANAKMVSIASEMPDNLGKYGLASPAVSLTILDEKGRSLKLDVGKKDGGDYFARDASRPTIFRINEDLYKKLAQNSRDLRDKKLVRFDSGDLNRIEIHNSNGTIVFVRSKDNKSDQWLFESPEAQKGKQSASWRFFTSIIQARAQEIVDHPTADISSLLAKPAIEVILTTADAKKLTLNLSKQSGAFVYARTSAGPEVYKLPAEIVKDLDFKAEDAVFER
jgi:Domain of unknown function (DUF4340)